MHPEITQQNPGNCTICGMKLIKQAHQSKAHEKQNPQQSYTPLVVIFLLLFVITAAFAIKDTAADTFSLPKTMGYFMAGFFLIFSGFKLMDLRGFADGYATYDLLAMRVKPYGYVYPFLELGLGILYVLAITPPAVHAASLALMAFSGIGVAIKIAKREQFQCACLGTFLKVPLTKVTLTEDFGMALMAAIMLAL